MRTTRLACTALSGAGSSARAAAAAACSLVTGPESSTASSSSVPHPLLPPSPARSLSSTLSPCTVRLALTFGGVDSAPTSASSSSGSALPSSPASLALFWSRKGSSNTSNRAWSRRLACST